MKTYDSIETAIEDLVPKSLDDIIRQRRELAQLGLATAEQLAELHRTIPTTDYVRGEVSDWRFVTYCVAWPNKPAEWHVHLLGDKGRDSWMTSALVGYDPGTRLVATHSGSIYRLVGNPGEGEPPAPHLMHVCSAFWQWGRGEPLGVPHFFY